MDSIILTKGVIAYFFDEFLSSTTAWLGVIFIGASIFVEKAVVDGVDILQEMKQVKGKSQGPNQIGAESSMGTSGDHNVKQAD